MMNSVDFSDPDQAATALQAMMVLMKRKRVMVLTMIMVLTMMVVLTVMIHSIEHDDGDQVLSEVVGGGEETTTPFSNIFPTTTLPTLGLFSYKQLF